MRQATKTRIMNQAAQKFFAGWEYVGLKSRRTTDYTASITVNAADSRLHSCIAFVKDAANRDATLTCQITYDKRYDALSVMAFVNEAIDLMGRIESSTMVYFEPEMTAEQLKRAVFRLLELEIQT